MKYSHLNDETREIMKKSPREKVKWVNNNHFVYYDKAAKIIKKCLRVYEIIIDKEGNFLSDIKSISIVGDSGLGKSAIIEEVERIIHKKYKANSVGHCLLKDSATGLRGLYSSILSAFGSEYGDLDIVKRHNIRVDTLENTLLRYLRNSRIKLLFIDEFQHAEGRGQQSIINQLKRTMLAAQVPFVPVGIEKGVRNILSQDKQLARRCPIKPYSELHYWVNDDGFKAFLREYEHFLPFPESSGLDAEDMAGLIFNKVKFEKGIDHPVERTDLRELTGFLKDVAVAALKAREKMLTKKIIKDTLA